MNVREYLKNPYVQAVLLVLGLALYLLSPNDSFRLISGVFLAAVIIGLVLLEMKEGVKEHGWQHELKDTAIAIGVALAIWYGAQFLLHTNSPISAVVTCSMLPNLQRGDFAVVQGAPVTAYPLEMTTQEIESLYGTSQFEANGRGYAVKGSIPAYCIHTREAFCSDFIAHPEDYPEKRGPLTIHYSSCTMDIRNQDRIPEPCVTSVDFNGKNYPPNLSNDVIVYQPAKSEIYSLSGDIIHRAYFRIKNSETGKYFYLTKGDNNQVLDIQAYDYGLQMGNDPVSEDKMKGRLLARVPLLGYYKLILSGFFTEPKQCAMLLGYPHV